MSGVQLEEYELVTPIGRGGMGEVWLGEHLVDRSRVAIKVLTARRATERRYRRSFRNEARAVAGLDHPNIVDIYHFGEISPEAEIRSGHRYPAGTQYMVMELVEGGTLSGRRGRLQWHSFRRVLMSLLDALSHAHARDVIHRDLKPGNVLFGNGGSGIKLTDFGLAHAVDREGITMDTPRASVGGTPAYMAPEQFYGSSRDVGPWSDLYALGCLVHTMLMGSPPFGRKPWLEVANGHLYRQVPTLAPEMAVPAGFVGWVEGLLEKSPADRYRRAADAAWDLGQLDDPSESLWAPLGPLTSVPSDWPRSNSGLTDSSAMESAPASQTTLVWGRHETLVPLPQIEMDAENGDEGPSPRRPPPMPSTWRGTQDSLDRTASSRWGTSLFVHRTIAMVGREKERDALWRALRLTREEQRVRAVLIRGTAGCGKSRLAEWLCQRAHEMGAAQVLRAVHSPIATRSDGLAPMVQRYFRSAGLEKDEVVERIIGTLAQLSVDDSAQVRALTQIVLPTTYAEWSAGFVDLRFATAGERHEVLQQFLSAAARRRPLVLWLEDVQWGLDTLEFVERLLGDDSERAILVLMTARDEDLSSRSLETMMVESVLENECSELLSLGALDASDSETLIRQGLGLDADLAAVVEKRTAGNPQFAVRLVAEWVGRGVLEQGPAGWRLAKGAEFELPDDLHDAWSHAIDRALVGRSADDGIALEIAAILGMQVEIGEWRAACGAATLRPSRSLLEAVLGRGLGKSDAPERYWTFANGMVRESLLRRARDAGRWASHHRICAAQLKGELDLLQTERLARHLAAAGAYAEALEPMRRSASGYIETAEYRSAQAILVALEEAMVHLKLADDDLAWAKAWVLRARLYRTRRDPTEAGDYAVRAAEVAREKRDGATLLAALRESGLLEVLRGDLAAAFDILTEARALAARLRNPRSVAELSMDLGWVAMQRGKLDVAEATFSECISLFDALGDGPAAAGVWMGLSDLSRKAGKWRQAIERAERGRACWEAQGARSGVARAINIKADVQRLMGALAEAEAGFREAIARFDRLGMGKTAIARVNLALVLIARDHYVEAEQILRAFLEAIHPSRVGINAIVHASLAPCAAAAKDWDAVDFHLGRAVQLAESVGYVDTDLADGFQRCALICRKSGQYARAKECLERALEQWVAMRRRDRVAEVRRRLAAL